LTKDEVPPAQRTNRILQNLAEENLELFLACFQKGHEALQHIALEVVTDIIVSHPSLLIQPLGAADTSESPTKGGAGPRHVKPVIKAYLKALTMFAKPSKEAPESLALKSALALSKLLLLSILPQPFVPDVLKTLILAFFNPETAVDPGFRQVLNYFLPVYCHSKRSNAMAVSSVIVPTVGKLIIVAEEALEEEEGQDWVGWATVAGMLADWTDGRRCIGKDGLPETSSAPAVNVVVGELIVQEPHVLLADAIVERVMAPGCGKEERKPLLSILSKLHIPPPYNPGRNSADFTSIPKVSEEAVLAYRSTLVELLAQVTCALDERAAPDATSRTALVRMQTQLTKMVGENEVVVQSVEDETEANTSPAEETKEEQPVDEAESNDTLLPEDAKPGHDYEFEDTEMPDAEGTIMPTDLLAELKEREPTMGTSPVQEESSDNQGEGEAVQEETTVQEVQPAPRRRGRPGRTSRLLASRKKKTDDSLVEELLDSEI
jgi:condensin complex subunit 3